MDVKASARAKHASSQRGRARHSSRKHHPQQQQQAGQDAALPQPSPDKTAPLLPSNWSRYEEEDDLPVDERLSDVPAVKSKGANYRDLLAEKSMFQAPDLASGRKNLMAAHGKDLWARLRDVDNVWNIHKVSAEEDNFFTLDLDFLSQELEKVDIAERLFVDPKYIPSEERENSESIYKDSMIETYDEKENNTLVSRTSRPLSEVSVFTKTPDSASSKVVESSSTKEGWLEGVSDYGRLEEAVANIAASCQNDKFEGSDGKPPQLRNGIHRVLKDTLAELPKTTDTRFEAKSAEAELDALLDMLDDKMTGEASNAFPRNSFGYAKSQDAASQRYSYVDVLQENRPRDPSVDTSFGSSSKLVVGASNDSLLDLKGSLDAASKADNLPSRAPAVGNSTSVWRSSEVASKINNGCSRIPTVGDVSSVPDHDDDFDDWLDSL